MAGTEIRSGDKALIGREVRVEHSNEAGHVMWAQVGTISKIDGRLITCIESHAVHVIYGISRGSAGEPFVADIDELIDADA